MWVPKRCRRLETKWKIENGVCMLCIRIILLDDLVLSLNREISYDSCVPDFRAKYGVQNKRVNGMCRNRNWCLFGFHGYCIAG